MPEKRFRYTGRWQQFDVPKKVDWVWVTLHGAGSNGVPGGRVSGRIRVTDRQTLWIMVGGKGHAPKGRTGGTPTFGGGGRGGDGRGGDAGWGGGGASAIRLNSRTGTIKAVAGGAGGTSGDGGRGGRGGDRTGENGHPGNAGTGQWGNASGGTQSQGGNRGTSSAGEELWGWGAPNIHLHRGGLGAGPGLPNTYGGGGGGGGYYSGGGGQAGLLNETPGGGGGGGSNYVGGLIGWESARGEGSEADGFVEVSWVSPPPANQPPSPPTDVKINGKPASDGFVTNSTGTVKVSAKVDDPKAGQKVRLMIWYSPNEDFSGQVRFAESKYIEQPNNLTGKRRETGIAEVTLRGLAQNTRYYLRMRTRDNRGARSTNYTSANFWTNRFPLAPELLGPPDNASLTELQSPTFEWKHRDPDDTQTPVQDAFEIQWRRAQSPTTPAGKWQGGVVRSRQESWTGNPGEYKPNTHYQWRVRTRDPQKKWGPWSHPFSFFVTGTTAPAIPLGPAKGEAVNVDDPITFSWRFRSPDMGDSQEAGEIRYRRVKTRYEPEDVWFTLTSSESEPGSDEQWTIPENTLMPSTHYEWQVRTRASLTQAWSPWSESEDFWTISTPGLGEDGVSAALFDRADQTIQGALGCGSHRVFVYDRGGRIMRGEITPLARLTYTRKRDDIGNCLIDTNGFGEDCCQLLSELRSWMHEIVVFRDGERVWEGPITRITYSPDNVSIEAKDCMAYVYRRIMRQGYDDTYHVVNGQNIGQLSVVERATRIIQNALAPDDPNLLPFLTTFNFPDDARQSRSVPDWSKTAWEEVDNLAATAGLDYTTVGRRILLWDTHRPIGRLPEMRDEHFNDPPVVTEYGMQTATVFAVTNNSGIYGYTTMPDDAYGMVEQLASAYGETEGGSVDTLTSAEREALEETLQEQAERNMSGRWPTPLVVRVPDNSQIHPEANVTIQQLVPGVWIPLRSMGTCRDVAQWQKLDLVTVEQTDKGEKITVTMSPAPQGGQDPDADSSLEEE